MAVVLGHKRRADPAIQQPSQTRYTRRCADCRREFERPQEYQGSPRGIICRNRRRCAERAAPVNGRRVGGAR
jgi:hypothetical protein